MKCNERSEAARTGTDADLYRKTHAVTAKKRHPLHGSKDEIAPNKKWNVQEQQKRRNPFKTRGLRRFRLYREWSERRDLNPRPFAPEANALPDCATLRKKHGELYSFCLAKSSPAMPILPKANCTIKRRRIYSSNTAKTALWSDMPEAETTPAAEGFPNERNIM